MKDSVLQKCQELTIRVKVVALRDQKEQGGDPEVVSDYYKVFLSDLGKPAMLVLRRMKSRKLSLQANETYIGDRLRLKFNSKGGIILTSTQRTVGFILIFPRCLVWRKMRQCQCRASN